MSLARSPSSALPDAELTYAQTDDLVNRVANVLVGLGCGVGDIVMVRAPNGWGTLAGWLACAKLGAVFLLLNALLIGRAAPPGDGPQPGNDPAGGP